MAVEPEAMVKAVELVESALAVLVVVEAVESETAAVTVVAEAMANYCDGIKIKQAKNTYLIVRVSFLFHLKKSGMGNKLPGKKKDEKLPFRLPSRSAV